MVATAQQDEALLRHVAEAARAKGELNLAVAALVQLQDTRGVVDVLMQAQRLPEAALFARTYAPHLVPETVRAWKASIRAQSSQKQQELAERIGEPHTMPELFPEGGYT